MNENENSKNNLIIKATNNKIQVFLMLFMWSIAILLFFLKDFELITSKEFRIIALSIIMNILLTIWLFSVKLIINQDIVIYKSGFLTRKLLISSIYSISSDYSLAGQYTIRDVTIQSVDQNAKNIKFNLKYFSKKDFGKFLRFIVNINQNILLDEDFKNHVIQNIE